MFEQKTDEKWDELPIVLVVAEKPRVARSIAEFLSGGIGRYYTRTGGRTPVHEFSGVFQGKMVQFRVTATCGHFYKLEFPGKFRLEWRHQNAPIHPKLLLECDLEPFVACDNQKEKRNGRLNHQQKRKHCKIKMNEHLATESIGCDFLVLFLDCDRPGDHICLQVVKAVKDNMGLMSTEEEFLDRDRVFRARFKAITESEIKKAMANLEEPDWNSAKSDRLRAEVDLRVGCAYTRVFTQYLKNKYMIRDIRTLSFGPCQSLIVSLCVNRHQEIQKFEPKQTVEVEVLLELSDNETIALNLQWESSGSDISSLEEKIKAAQFAEVMEIFSPEKSIVIERPEPLNSFYMYEFGSGRMNESPVIMADDAQWLYEKGEITYPRTEASTYPPKFDFDTISQKIYGEELFQDLSPEVKKQVQEGIDALREKEANTASSHPPLTPCSNDRRDPVKTDLNYYIRIHFLASLMRNCEYRERTVKFVIAGEQFSVSCRQVTEPGFTLVMPWRRVKEGDQRLMDLGVGQRLKIRSYTVVSKECSPLQHFSEAEIVAEMKTLKIGTSGTLPDLIDDVCNKNKFLKLEMPDRRLVPTPLGIALIQGIQALDPDLLDPNMRRKLESKLETVAEGVDPKKVKEEILKDFVVKFPEFYDRVVAEGMDEFFYNNNFRTLEQVAEPLSKCGICGNDAKLVKSTPPKLFCPICNVRIELPTRIVVKRHREGKCCERDGYGLLYYEEYPRKGAETEDGEPKPVEVSFCPRCGNPKSGHRWKNRSNKSPRSQNFSHQNNRARFPSPQSQPLSSFHGKNSEKSNDVEKGDKMGVNQNLQQKPTYSGGNYRPWGGGRGAQVSGGNQFGGRGEFGNTLPFSAADRRSEFQKNFPENEPSPFLSTETTPFCLRALPSEINRFEPNSNQNAAASSFRDGRGGGRGCGRGEYFPPRHQNFSYQNYRPRFSPPQTQPSFFHGKISERNGIAGDKMGVNQNLQQKPSYSGGNYRAMRGGRGGFRGATVCGGSFRGGRGEFGGVAPFSAADRRSEFQKNFPENGPSPFSFTNKPDPLSLRALPLEINRFEPNSNQNAVASSFRDGRGSGRGAGGRRRGGYSPVERHRFNRRMSEKGKISSFKYNIPNEINRFEIEEK